MSEETEPWRYPRLSDQELLPCIGRDLKRLLCSHSTTALARRYRGPAAEDRDKALESYLLNHIPGLKEHHEAQHEAFLRIAEDTLA